MKGIAGWMLLACAAAAAGGCGDEGKASGKPASPPSGRRLAERLMGHRGLENFARVNAALYRGAQPTEEGFRELKALGIRSVIDFRSHHSSRKQAEAAGLVAIELPLRADLESVPPTEEDLRKFFEIVLDPVHQPVYIHCAFGKDRTGTMAAVYRMEMEGWTAEEAIQEMEAFGYHNIYHDLLQFIRSYTPRGYARGRERK